MSLDELAAALCVDRDKICKAVFEMARRNGGVMKSPDEPGRRRAARCAAKYELFKPSPEAPKLSKNGSGQIAGPRTMRGYCSSSGPFWRGTT